MIAAFAAAARSGLRRSASEMAALSSTPSLSSKLFAHFECTTESCAPGGCAAEQASTIRRLHGKRCLIDFPAPHALPRSLSARFPGAWIDVQNKIFGGTSEVAGASFALASRALQTAGSRRNEADALQKQQKAKDKGISGRGTIGKPQLEGLGSLDYYVNNLPAKTGPSRPKPKQTRDKEQVRGEDLVEGPLFSSIQGLPPGVVSTLAAAGFRRCTGIQAAAIGELIRGHDAAIQSYTGSGKTLAYLVPLLLAAAPKAWLVAQTQSTEVHNQNTTAGVQLEQGAGSSSQAESGGQEHSRAVAAEDGVLGGEAKSIAGTGLAGGNVQSPGEAGVRSRREDSGIRAMVVAPSQELAMQIVRETQRLLGPEHKNSVQQLIGGANQRRQEEALKKLKPPIVVGTPGRIAELSRAGRLQTHFCNFLVLDEADALLSHRFRPDMLRILDHVGRKRGTAASSPPGGKSDRQMVLVSATLSGAVLEAASRWAHDPLLIQCLPNDQPQVLPMALPPRVDAAVKGAPASEEGEAASGSAVAADSGITVGSSLSPSLEHYFIVSDQRHKVDAVRRCLHATKSSSAMVFMNFPQRLQDVQHKLEARGITAAVLHGQMQKLARANVLSAFRSGKVQVLLLSDVGARGLDVLECDLVVNLELPSGAPHYAHRAGRTGRLGRRGLVISICESSEVFVMKKLERQLGVHFARADTVGGKLVPLPP